MPLMQGQEVNKVQKTLFKRKSFIIVRILIRMALGWQSVLLD